MQVRLNHINIQVIIKVTATFNAGTSVLYQSCKTKYLKVVGRKNLRIHTRKYMMKFNVYDMGK